MLVDLISDQLIIFWKISSWFRKSLEPDCERRLSNLQSLEKQSQHLSKKIEGQQAQE